MSVQILLKSLVKRSISRPLFSSQIRRQSSFPIPLTWHLSNGSTKQTWATPGENLLDHAIDNSIDEEQDGYFGMCGGAVCCSTCHVILDENVYDGLDQCTEEEDDLLDYVKPLTTTSRLACCIEVVDAMDGTVIKLPESVVDLRD